MYTQRTIMWVLPLLLAGCIGDDIKDELRETRKLIDSSVNTLALAVPGERYLRLLEDTHSKDEKIRQQAQETARLLFGVAWDKQYEATVAFEASDDKPLHAIVFQAGTNDQAEVRLYIDSDKRPLEPVRLRPPELLTQSDIAKKVREEIGVAIDQSFGGATAISGYWRWPSNTILQQLQTGPGPDVVSAIFAERVKLQKSVIADHLYGAMTAEYSKRALPAAETVLSVTWLPANGPYLFVLIDERDWKAHAGKIVCRGRLHTKAKSDEPYRDDYTYTIADATWVYQPKGVERVIKAEKWGTNVRWAVMNLTGDALTRQQVDAMVSARQALADLETLRKERARLEPPRKWWEFWKQQTDAPETS